MRLLTFSLPSNSDSWRFGVLSPDGNGVIDLATRMDVASLDELIRTGRIDDARAHIDSTPDYAVETITFERTLVWPRKVFCIGVNYGGRSAEYADKSDASYPSVFIRYPDSFVGHEQPLLRPPESEQLDYEGEIVAVIGTRARRVPVDGARAYIAGFTLGNEGSIRDWIRHAKFNVTQGKNWEGSGAIGPWMVTADEVDTTFEDLHLTTTVNGELRQDDTPATMKYSIDYLVHYLSSFTTLEPGDIIFTGTPTGAGARFDPPVWLRPGDVVEVNVPELGTLRNPIADEFPEGADHVVPEPQ